MNTRKKKVYILLLILAVSLSIFLGKDKIAFHFSLNKAFYYMENTDYLQAANEFDFLISQEPNMYELYINKAVALANLEEFEEALRTFQEAETINNTDPELYYNLAHLYDIMGEEVLKQECLKKGTELAFEIDLREDQ